MRKSRGESITSCLSRSNSSDSELNVRLLALYTAPSRGIRDGKRNFSECSDATNITQGSLSSSMATYCRICHDGDGDEKLMRACRCHGSIKHVHHQCLLNWVSISGDLVCEICKFNYNVVKSRRKKFSEWHLPPIEPQGWLHIVLFLAFFAMLITSLSWLIWCQTSSSSTAIFERTSTEVKYAYILNGVFILTAVIGIILDSCKQAKKYLQRALALNQEITIQEYKEKTDHLTIEKRRETVGSQTLNALTVRQFCDRNIGSSFIPETSEQQDQPFSNVMTYSTFVEIDLNKDEERSNTILPGTERGMEFFGNFQCLNDLMETCI